MTMMNPNIGINREIVNREMGIKMNPGMGAVLGTNSGTSSGASPSPADRADAVNTEMNTDVDTDPNTGMSKKLSPREMKNEPLLARLGKLAKAERELTAEVVEFIAEVKRRRLYLSQGCTSLFAFLTCRLGYSESAAQRRIEAARILEDVPELKDDLKSGEINLSQVGVIAQGLRQQKQQQEQAQKQQSQKSQQPQQSQSPQPQQPSETSVMTKPTAELKRWLLAQVKGQSVSEAQKTVAGALNLDVKQGEKRRTQKDGSERVEITFSPEEVAELKRMKDLISHTHLNPSLAEVVMVAVRDFLKRKDPLRSPVRPRSDGKYSENRVEDHSDHRANDRSEGDKPEPESKSNPQSKPGSKPESTSTAEVKVEENQPLQQQQKQKPQQKREQKREHWPVNTKRAVFQRDQCCQWRDSETNEPCGSTFQLQIDHVQALWTGGSSEVNNLQLLCSIHNKLKYQMEIMRQSIV